MARVSAASLSDPGRVWADIPVFAAGLAPNTDTTVKTVQTAGIDPTKKTLVLISAGQSLMSDVCPTNYTPVSPGKIDNLHPVTGGLYKAADPLLGTSLQAAGVGVANINLRLADTLVANGWDRVIIVPVCVAATSIAQWSGAGAFPAPLCRTIQSAALKLASRGITPTTTGVTFVILWNQGESDTQNGTTQAAYATGLVTLKAAVDLYLPGVRWIVSRESWISGVTSAAVQAAQAAFVDNVTVFAGANFDSMNATFRDADNTHLNDTGAANAASLLFTAMHASGAPF